MLNSTELELQIARAEQELADALGDLAELEKQLGETAVADDLDKRAVEELHRATAHIRQVVQSKKEEVARLKSQKRV